MKAISRERGNCVPREEHTILNNNNNTTTNMNAMQPIEQASASLRREKRLNRSFGYRTNRRQKELRIGFQMKELMKYLAIHDPEMLCRAEHVAQQYHYPGNTMRRHLRKTIGECHWRRYLDYYNHFEWNERERIRIELKDYHTMAPPPFPKLSKALDDDVTTVIFSFLDGYSMYTASQVSRSFRDALIPRQRNVTMAGFPSLEAFRRFNFLGMEYFSGGRRHLITDEVLCFIAGDYRSYPNLSSIDVNFCKSLTGYGEIECQMVMGPRLERLSGDETEVW